MFDNRSKARAGTVSLIPSASEGDESRLAAVLASHQAALMSAPTPYLALTTDGETVLINDAFVRATGYTINDLPNIRACLEKCRRMPVEELDTAVDGWRREQDRASTKKIELWTAWGEMRTWVIHTSDPVLWPDGRKVVIQWMFDVTEQRRLEEALRRSQEDLRLKLMEVELLYSRAPIGIAMLDRDLKYVRVNPALAEMNGLPVEAYPGQRPFDLLPQLRQPLESAIRSVLETGVPVSGIEFEAEMPRCPGDVRSWVEYLYPLLDHAGAVMGVGVLADDVTDRKRVETELASANVALRRTLDLLFLALRIAGVSVFTQDKDLRYIWVGGDYFGCDPEAAAGRDDADLLPRELVAPMASLKARVLQTGEPASADLPYQKDGKTHWCNIHVEPWRSRNGVVQSLLGAVSDVSERKATEHHIRTLLSELAHRSKNLLTVIQVMARRSVSPGLSSSDFVDSFIERLSSLAQSHDLLAREDWRGISMQELVTSQLGHLTTGAAERLVIDGPDLVLTPVAAQNLGMALHELSTNAVKYGALSVVDGRVRISWSVYKDEAGQDRMRLSWVERGGPTVKEPSRRGFGRFVIEAIAARALAGAVDLRFDPEGVSCIIDGAADSSVIANGPVGSR